MTSPEIWVVNAAASRIMPAARLTLNAAHPRVAPVSLAIAFTKSSSLAANASATLKSAARRAFGPWAAHAGKAMAALSATASASATVIAFALLAISLVIGLKRENVVTVIEVWSGNQPRGERSMQARKLFKEDRKMTCCI